MLFTAAAQDQYLVRIKSHQGMQEHVAVKGHWTITCKSPDGETKWVDHIENLVVNTGLDYLIGVALAGIPQITTWHIGLASATPTPQASDTIATHPGWTEVTVYSESTRPIWVGSVVSGGVMDNSASQATFHINANATLGGAFLASNNTKGSSAGTLYAIGAFSVGNRPVTSGDEMQLTAQYAVVNV